MPDTVAILLAAGKSTRMKSELPKVLHPINGQLMIDYVIDTVRKAGATRVIVVIGHKAEEVRSALGHHADLEFAYQTEQKGTGHAVMMCEELLTDFDGRVLVLAGDTPLLRSQSLSGLLTELETHRAACVVGTAVTENNHGLGRIVRDQNGQFLKIVEQKDATPEELEIKEINTGCFAYQSKDLFQSLQQIKPDNNQAEYYLTDCAEILLKSGKPVLAWDQFTLTEAMGVNTQEQLKEIEQILLQASQA